MDTKAPKSKPKQEPIEQNYSAPSQSPSRNYAPLILAVFLLLVVVLVFVLALKPSNKTVTTTNTTQAASITTALVVIKNNQLTPDTITINKGQEVEWINEDSSPHLIASDPYPSDNALPGFKSDQELNHNDRYYFKFNNTGTFTYHDDLNPFTIKGTVVVK